MIAVSANAFEQARQQSAVAGCNAFLTKPVHIDDLLESLHMYLGVEWIYASSQNEETSGKPKELFSEKSEIIPPPDNILADLIACVKKGDLLRVTDYLVRDGFENDRYTPFVERVLYLARTFQIDALEHFLHHYL